MLKKLKKGLKKAAKVAIPVGAALLAARALKRNSNLTAKEIATESLKIAAELCIYTNETLNIAEIKI